MTKTQVAAATFLINKRMPNPPESHEHEGTLEVLIRTFGAPHAE